jgi:alpha-ketoglutarate-dependent 2,4-dichlorophenoxyacetate dioxygenase
LRAAYDALDAATKTEVEDPVCEHSLMYSREQLVPELTADEREAMRPVRQRLVRSHPVTDGSRCSGGTYWHHRWLVGAGGARFHPRPDGHATQPQFVYSRGGNGTW